MNEIRFLINISADQYLAYYKGAARDALVKSRDGRLVRFPAAVLRPHLTHSGIRGEFALQFDADNRFVALKRIA